MTTAITFGTSYYPDHWPQTAWQRDLELMRDSGITAVRFGEFSWSWFMPRPGVYDFAACDQFMALAHQCGLGVMLCTPTCNPPHWFFTQYPDARQVDQHGQSHIGHRHMACYNHPAALAAAHEIVVKLAQHYRDHPALIGWQIDNELTAGESANLHRLYDYHPLTLALYRAYLRDKYSTLDALNDYWWNNFWGNRYTSWDEIDPPRPGLSGNISPAMWLEWMRFRGWNVARFGRQQAVWLREINPDFYVGTNVPEVSPLKGAILGQDYWALCQEMDFIGTDLYVYDGNHERNQQQLAYSCDVIRSAATASGADFGVLEVQAGPHIRPWRMTFSGGYWGPDFLHSSVQTFAAHGARFIYFFLWRATQGGAEFGMNGLLNLDGSPSERSQQLPEIIAHTASAQPDQRPVAYIHYSQDTLNLLALYDPDNTGDTALPGWHALLEDLGYQVDFVSDADLFTLEQQPPGPLVLAQSMVLSCEVCDWLVSSSRPLIAAGAPAYFDAYARVYPLLPGGALSQRLGVHIEAFEANRRCNNGWISGDDLPLLNARIRVISGEVLHKDDNDQPLMVHTNNSLYISFDLGTLYHRTLLAGRNRMQQRMTLAMSTILSGQR
jgi:beta-galactosidase